MRLLSALWIVVVIAAWLGGLAGAVALDPNDGKWYVIIGLPLTLAAGLLLNRWWAVLVPWLVTVIVFAVAIASDPSCSDCGDEDYGVQITIALFIFTFPATLLMGIGVMVRRLRADA